MNDWLTQKTVVLKAAEVLDCKRTQRSKGKEYMTKNEIHNTICERAQEKKNNC